jgi:transcription-repair coupling factor (superfamily II helicase)
MSPVHLPESRTLRLSRLYPGSLYKAASGTMLLPRPTTGGFGSAPLGDHDLLQWCREVLESVVLVR